MKIVKEVDTGDVKICTIYGNSSEDKPVNDISDGSVFVETNTLKVYMFDEANAQWRELGCQCQQAGN